MTNNPSRQRRRLLQGAAAVPLAGIFGRAWDAIRLWIK